MPSCSDPRVGIRGQLRLRRCGGDAEFLGRVEERLRPRPVERHAVAEAERQHVVHRDGADGWHRRAVDRAERIEEHLSIGELGQQVVDRVVEAQPALLDQHERGHRRDRLAHRRDAEHRVALDRRGLAAGRARRWCRSRRRRRAPRATPHRRRRPARRGRAITSVSRSIRCLSNPLMPRSTVRHDRSHRRRARRRSGRRAWSQRVRWRRW